MCLSTSSLVELIAAKKSKVIAASSMDSYRQRLSSNVMLTSNLISKILAKSWFDFTVAHKKDIRNLHPICKTIPVIQILCQTLADEFELPDWRSPNTQLKPPRTLSTPKYHALVNHLLGLSGWYRREDIETLPLDVCFRYYLTFHYRSNVRGDPEHLGYGSSGCSRTDEEPVLPRHTHQLCKCAYIEALTSTVEGCVSNKRFPVFRFRQDSGTSRVLETRLFDLTEGSTLSFIAISHVRMAGLGNDDGNSLPFCQLTLIQSLADQMNYEIDGSFFWIDTLCIPLDTRIRKTALHLVWDIYSRASSVLVLDPPLYQHVVSSSEEALNRIRYSTWKSRFWTLEEAFVAKNLVFRFANRMTSLQGLLDDFEADPEPHRSRFHALKKRKSYADDIDGQFNADEKCAGIMRRFENDVHAWFNNNTSGTIVVSPDEDKLILYKLLRLGFLTARKFRYFTEDNERIRGQALWHFLLNTYDSAEAGYLDRGNDLVLQKKQVYVRLKQVYAASEGSLDP